MPCQIHCQFIKCFLLCRVYCIVWLELKCCTIFVKYRFSDVKNILWLYHFLLNLDFTM